MIQVLSAQAESQLDPRRLVDIGLDISTACTGYCVVDTLTGDVLDLGHFKLTSVKFDDVYDKADYIRNSFCSLIDLSQCRVNKIYVEEYAMQFGGGKTTAKTLFSLAAFNATVCYAMYDLFKVKPTKIMVRSARSRLGIKIDTKDKSLTTKEKVFNKVFEMHPEFPWEQHKAPTGQHAGEMVYGKVNQDMADAFVIVKGGQRLSNSLVQPLLNKIKK